LNGLVRLDFIRVGYQGVFFVCFFSLALQRLLQLGQCATLRFARRSAYGVLREIAECLERLTDGQPFESILLDGSQVLPMGEAEFAARQIALRLQFSRELVALLVGNRLALLPGFVWTRSLVAPGTRDGEQSPPA